MLLRLAASLLAAATSAYAAHNVTVSVNSTSVEYSGSADTWVSYTSCGGTKYTYAIGQFFNFNFVGIGVYVVGTLTARGGIVTFNLDGVTSTFDRYNAAGYQCGIPFFGKGGLENTSHTLTATLTGPSSENSTSNPYLEYQYILYTVMDPTDSLTTSSSFSTSTTATSSTTTSPAPTLPASGKVNAAAIGGGIAAGAVGLLIIGFVIGFCIRRGRQEKMVVVAPRKGLEIPRQSFIDSTPGGVGFGRLSPEVEQGRATSPAHGGTATTSWGPDPEMGSTISPRFDSPMAYYPFGAAAPSVIQSSSQSSSSSPVQTYSTGIPHSTVSGYTVQNPTPGTEPSLMGTVQLPDSDVERIAARVTSMMNQPAQLPPGARLPESSSPPPMKPIKEAEAEEKPPPMYELRQDP